MKGNDVVLYHLPGVTYVKNITKPLMTKVASTPSSRCGLLMGLQINECGTQFGAVLNIKTKTGCNHRERDVGFIFFSYFCRKAGVSIGIAVPLT